MNDIRGEIDTTAGNLQAPDKLLCLEWVKESLESCHSRTSNNSFVSCSISVTTDGFEDGCICIKLGLQQPQHKISLKRQPSSMLPEEDSDDNPFTSYDEEMKDDETVIDDK